MLDQFNESAQADYEKLGKQHLTGFQRSFGKKVLELIDDALFESAGVESILLGLAAALDQTKANYTWAPTDQIRLGTAISSLVVAAKAE